MNKDDILKDLNETEPLIYGKPNDNEMEVIKLMVERQFPPFQIKEKMALYFPDSSWTDNRTRYWITKIKSGHA